MEDELLDALDIIEEVESVIPLTSLAFVEPVGLPQHPEEGFIVTLSTNREGLLAPGSDLAAQEAMQPTVATALGSPGKVIMGPAFQSAVGRQLTLLATAAPNAGVDGAVVTIVDLSDFIHGLHALHIPQGLHLRLIEESEREIAGRLRRTIIGSDAAPSETVQTFTILTDSGQMQWEFNWDVLPGYLGGPATQLADVVQLGGTVLIALAFAMIGFLSIQNAKVSLLVRERTVELSTANTALKKQIAERRQAEEALRESEELFRTIGTAAQDAIIVIDNDANISYWNEAAEGMFGYAEAEVLGENLHDLLSPPRFHDDHRRGFAHCRETGEGPGVGRTVELWAFRKSGEEFPISLSLSSVKLRGKWQAIGIVRDVTERKRAEETIKHLAYHDTLTGLPNRRLFNDRLNLAMAHAERNQQKLAVILFDLDHFKEVNDTLGHSVGDQLLQVVGERLTSLLRKGDTVARMGGDEFMLLLPEIAQVEDAAEVAQKILEAIREPYVFDGHELHITTSIGIALYPDDGEDGDTLMKNADIAMYRAKDQGRDNYQSWQQ